MPEAQSTKRREDARLVTGAGRYTADLRRAGMAELFLLRSPLAHARIRSIDVAAAREAPGVLGVFTGADLAADGMPDLPCGVEQTRPDGKKAPQTLRPVLARDRVRHLGEPVVAIIGETLDAAIAASELVAIDYDDLPAVATLVEAVAASAPAVWEEAPDNIAYLWRRGDAAAIDAALRDAAHVTRLDFAVTRVNANPLEPRGCVGAVEADGRLVLHISHQSPYQLKTALAALFRVEPRQVRIIAGDVGGSFGMKSGVHPEDVVTLWAARRLGRPVRWISDRSEAFLSDDHARDVRFHAELALDKEHNFTAFRLQGDIGIGCYLSGRSSGLLNNIGGIAGVYRTKLISAELRAVFTNTAPTAPYRGAGRPEATYAIERLIDVAARELGLEPFELRRRNLIPTEAMPFKTGFTFTYDCGDFPANMREAARLADFAGFAARREEAKRRGRLRGLGIANPIEVAGGPFLKPGKDNAWLGVAPDGTVTIHVGAMSVGQGLETALPLLVAERLGIPAERVAYAQGDTDQLPAGRGSGGSSGLCVGGTAVVGAIDKVLEKGRRLAGELLEAAAADIAFADGSFTVAGTDHSATLAEVARFAEDPARLPEGMTPGLAEHAEFQPTEVTFPNGCHMCEVEIDPETGVTEIQRYTIVEDVGRVLNPTLVRGQIQGGVAQGVGQALGEVMEYDRENAQLLTASFLDYMMPRADNVPSVTIATREVPTKVNALGVKGVGEAGTVGSLAATMNAVCDALAPLGIRHLEMPASPARIWAAIAAARG
jgi:carbon-monoxide dehydrogenase large subunit